MRRKVLVIAIVVALALVLTFALAGPALANGSPPPQAESILIDIKPDGDPNVINMKSRGVIPVAILGSNDLDVTNIDVSTIVFICPRPSSIGVPPVRDPALKDVNSDGFIDLLCHFKTQDTDLTSGDTSAGIIAQLNSGSLIEGFDDVIIKHG